jgi:mevalonate pyrophosphate decarboxylase
MDAETRLKALRLVLQAAREHHGNYKWWASVPGAAYFAANLRRFENRQKLADAIRVIEKEEIPHGR